MANNSLDDRLVVLYQKRDHIDQFYDADLKTIIDAIRDAREHGGTASVDITPISGGGGYTITITDSEGTEHTATVKDGGDAYEVYKSTVPSGQTPMSKADWLASLKGENGDNAVNPFKGWYDSSSNLPTNPVVGDYAYVKGASSNDPAAIYECTTTGSWSDSGRTADTSNVQTFASSEEVNGTYIDDTNLLNPKIGSLAKAENVLQLKNRIGFEKETKIEPILDWHPVGETQGYYEMSDNVLTWNNVSRVNKFLSTKISIKEGATRIRFLGYNYDFGDNPYYVFLDESESPIIGSEMPYYDANKDTGVCEIVVYQIPSNAKYFVCLYSAYSTVTTSIHYFEPEDFYLYLYMDATGGKKVIEYIDYVEGNINSVIDNVDKSIKGGFAVDASIDGKTATATIGDNVSGASSWSEISGYFTPYDTFLVRGSGTSYRIDLQPYISEGYNHIRIYRNNEYACGFTVTKSEAPTESTTGVTNYLADVMRGTSRIDFSDEFYEFDLPEQTDAKYLYFVKYVTSTSSGNITPKDVFIQKGTAYKGIIEEVQNNELGLHTMPTSVGQLNLIKRCRQMTDIEWTPAVDLPMLDMSTLTPPDVPGDSIDEFYQNTFKAGHKYKGIPYGRCTTYKSNYGYNNTYVGLTIDFSTFITSVRNADSMLCKESVFSLSDHRSVPYAAVCSALTCYALNVPYVSTSQITNINGLNRVGAVVTNGVRIDLSLIRLGDVLNKAGYHTAVITDIVKNDGGIVEYIEVCEATPMGNGNRDVIGGERGGVCRRIAFSEDDFFWYFGGYNLLRYQYIDNIPYTKNPYVNIGNELDQMPILDYSIMPYEGNNFRYLSANTSSVKLIISCDNFTYVRVFKGDTEITGSPFSISSSDKELTITEVSVGEYSAYLCKMSNDVNTAMTGRCRWEID